MLLKSESEQQYCFYEARLPDILCDRKNKAVLLGQLVSKPDTLEDGICTLCVSLDGEVEAVEVLADANLIDRTAPKVGSQVVIDGEFVACYRTLRKYRPLIKVLARNIIQLNSAKVSEAVYSNRVYLEGVIADNPVIVTSFEGSRSLKTTILSNGSKIPCVIRGDVVQVLETIRRDEKYRMWGKLTTRTYQKRLGRGRFEIDTMNEVEVIEVQKLPFALEEPVHPEIEQGQMIEFVSGLNQVEFYVRKS